MRDGTHTVRRSGCLKRSMWKGRTVFAQVWRGVRCFPKAELTYLITLYQLSISFADLLRFLPDMVIFCHKDLRVLLIPRTDPSIIWIADGSYRALTDKCNNTAQPMIHIIMVA